MRLYGIRSAKDQVPPPAIHKRDVPPTPSPLDISFPPFFSLDFIIRVERERDLEKKDDTSHENIENLIFLLTL